MAYSPEYLVPWVAAFALAGIVGATPVQTASAADAAAEATPEGGLETIVVTARKRTESVQDVPVAVTAITGEEVRRQDLTSLEKLSEVTPDFNVGRSSNGSAAQLTIRGIGSSSLSIGIEQSVAVVVDDVYYGQGRVIEEGFFDLGEVEVLKGPQALFFGKNATAGVIAINTADPTSTPELLTKAAYEIESKQTQVEAIASGPLTDTLGLRVAVRGSIMNGGYYKNEADDVTYSTFDSATGLSSNHVAGPAPSDSPGEHELIARATLKWTPTDQLTGTFKLSSDYNYVNNSSWNFAAYNCPTGSLALNPQWACGNSFITHQNDMPTDIAQNYPFANGGGTYNRYQSYAATLTFAYKPDNYTFTSVSNYQTNVNSWLCACDFESSGPTGVWATENSTWYATSEEFRVLSTYHLPINFMVGGLAQKTMRVFNQWVTDGGVSDSAAPPQDEYVTTSKYSTTEGKTYSVFGQAIWDIVPTVEATAGLRYTHETKDSFFTQPYNNPLVTAIFRPENAPLGEVVANQLFTNVSPEATISWKPIQDIMFYGAYKTAYKSGGFDNSGIDSAAIPTNPAAYFTFKPEKAKGFEIGAKTTTLNNQLRVNVEAFDYRYTDLQVDFFNSPIFAYQTVSADARTAGAELDVEFAPRAVSGLSMHTTLVYDAARYTSFTGPCYAGQTPAEGCTIPSATLPFQPLTGAPTALAPLFTGTAGARYDMPLGGNGLHLASNLDARYSDAYLASGFNNPTSRQASYVTLDAGLRLLTRDDKYEFAVVGKNLTNRFYVNGVVDGPETGSGTGTPAGIRADQIGYGGLPRTIQFQVVGRFGL